MLLSTTNEFIKQVIIALEVRSSFNVSVETTVNVMGFSQNRKQLWHVALTLVPRAGDTAAAQGPGVPRHTPEGPSAGHWQPPHCPYTSPWPHPLGLQACERPRGPVFGAREIRSDCKARWCWWGASIPDLWQDHFQQQSQPFSVFYFVSSFS